MEIEKIAEILIYYVHAPLGGIALIVKKAHKLAKSSKDQKTIENHLKKLK